MPAKLFDPAKRSPRSDWMKMVVLTVAIASAATVLAVLGFEVPPAAADVLQQAPAFHESSGPTLVAQVASAWALTWPVIASSLVTGLSGLIASVLIIIVLLVRLVQQTRQPWKALERAASELQSFENYF